MHLVKVFYILIKFPLDSETFAGNDVLALYNKGVDVSVHSLKKKPKNCERLIEERNLNNIPITHSIFPGILSGIIFGFKRIGITSDLLFWLIKLPDHKKMDLLKSIILIPRVLNIFSTIQKENPSIVHLFWGHYPSMLGYLVQKYNPDIKLSIFLGAFDLEMNYPGTKPVAQKADAVFTHSKYNIPMITNLGVEKGKITVSYRGVNLEKFEINETFNKQNKRIVCAGRLVKSKGIDDVIRTYSRIREKYPESSLVFLGDGDQKEELMDLANSLNLTDSVEFKGHVAQSILFEEMKKAEIFMLLSKKQSERLPNVVKEAMLAKCICIVSKTPGIEELIDDGISGYIVDLDIEKIMRVIEGIYSDEQKKKLMIEKAQGYITENFDVNVSMNQYISKWEEVISSRPVKMR